MPQLVGAAIFAAIGASAAGAAVIVPGVTLAGLVGSIVVTGALVGAQLLLAAKPDIPKPQDGKILIKNAVPPPIFGVGTSRITGALVASEMLGSTSYDVIALQQGRAAGFKQFYLHEDAVSFDAGAVDGPVNFLSGSTGRYRGGAALTDHTVKLFWRLGLDPETAYPEMVSAFPELWGEDRRGDGVASLLCVTKTPDAEILSKRLPFGLPKPSAVGDWSIAWDPRDPTQIETAPATWKFTDNPVVLLLHYYCHWESGFRKPVARVFAPTQGWWIAAMDRCDEPMTRADGTIEPRYVASGFFTAETPRKSVLEAFARCCDGFFEEIGGGAVVVYAGAYYEPGLEINDAHVVDSTIILNYSEKDRLNQLNVKVTSREHDYNDVPADPWVDQAVIDAGEPVLAADAQAEWSPSWTQSRRLAKIEFDRKTAKVRGTLVLNLFGENLKGRRYFKLNLRQRGMVTRDLACEVVDLIDQSLQSGTWLLEFRSVRPKRYAWNPATEEGRPPPNPDNSENGDLPVPSVPTLSVVRQQVSGGGTIPVISATNPPVEGWPDLGLGGRYRRVGDTVWMPMSGESGTLQCFSAFVADGDYQVQTFFVGGGGGQSDPSPIATITVVSDANAPLAPVAGEAEDDGSGAVEVSFRTSNSLNGRALTFYRAHAWQAFAQAVDIGTMNAASPNLAYSILDEPGPGSWRWWARAANGSGVPSPVSAPTDDVTIGTARYLTLGGAALTLGGDALTIG